MTVTPRLRRAAGWAILGGVLLEFGHFSAIGLWQSILSLLLSLFPRAAAIIRVLGLPILLVASLGGLAVIIAGVLFLRGHTATGRLLIGFGAGFSILSFLIYLAFAVVGRSVVLSGNTVVVLAGLLLAIYARGLAR